MTQVNLHQAFRPRSIGVAMEASACRGREFYFHFGLLQPYGVIAGTHRFVVVAERRGVLFLVGHGQKRHVSQVADARAAEVQVREAPQHAPAVVIARAPVPPAVGLCGAELNESERHVGTEEHVSVSPRANPWVHISCRSVCLLPRTGGQGRQAEGSDDK